MSLELLQIDDLRDVDLYTSAFAEIVRYKRLNFMVQSSHECYVSLAYSVDGKTDSISQSYHVVGGSKWQNFRSETIADYVRLKVVSIDEHSLISNFNCRVRGRVNVSSGLNKLIEKFQPKESDTGRGLELNDEKENSKKEERKSVSLYTRLGLRSEKKEATQKEEAHQCKDPRLPDLILRGQLLYAPHNSGRLSSISPPPEDGKIYVLAMKNKCCFWINPHESGAGWF